MFFFFIFSSENDANAVQKDVPKISQSQEDKKIAKFVTPVTSSSESVTPNISSIPEVNKQLTGSGSKKRKQKFEPKIDSSVQKGHLEVVKNDEMISTISAQASLEFVPERSAAKKATTKIKKSEHVLTPKPKTKSEFTCKELKEKCAKLGLTQRGTKETMLARLQEHENKIKTVEVNKSSNETSNNDDEKGGLNEKSTMDSIKSEDIKKEGIEPAESNGNSKFFTFFSFEIQIFALFEVEKSDCSVELWAVF